MNLLPRLLAAVSLTVAAVAFTAPTAHAGDTMHHHAAHARHFTAHHPRRAQVLHRTAHQQRRITRQVRQGELSHRQAHVLRYRTHAVARAQRREAHRNGGYITRHQQHRLNRALNANSRRIGR